MFSNVWLRNILMYKKKKNPFLYMLPNNIQSVRFMSARQVCHVAKSYCNYALDIWSHAFSMFNVKLLYNKCYEVYKKNILCAFWKIIWYIEARFKFKCDTRPVSMQLFCMFREWCALKWNFAKFMFKFKWMKWSLVDTT